jgi:hypothetical protein
MNPVEKKAWSAVLYDIDRVVNEMEDAYMNGKGAEKTIAGYELKAWKHAQRSVLSKIVRAEEKQRKDE